MDLALRVVSATSPHVSHTHTYRLTCLRIFIVFVLFFSFVFIEYLQFCLKVNKPLFFFFFFFLAELVSRNPSFNFSTISPVFFFFFFCSVIVHASFKLLEIVNVPSLESYVWMKTLYLCLCGPWFLPLHLCCDVWVHRPCRNSAPLPPPPTLKVLLISVIR